MSERLPALFLGHGNPMNALQSNTWTRAWAALGASLPRPRAILCISAHWYVPATAVTAMPAPPTIHDFGGFPRELFAVRYPAAGDAGILILGSGDVVHNLHTYAWGRHVREPYDWALRFETAVRARLAAGDHAGLIDYAALGDEALLAVPTPEHYLPLLYVVGASRAGEAVSFPVEGMDGGSVSMLAVRFG
jgi:aromatic ring-opening dioxygenase catalytic subunit (LigB family)